ncbi:hypothetical protein DFH06DRAFT_1224396, partial [Mycena polygramma]
GESPSSFCISRALYIAACVYLPSLPCPSFTLPPIRALPLPPFFRRRCSPSPFLLSSSLLYGCPALRICLLPVGTTLCAVFSCLRYET